MIQCEGGPCDPLAQPAADALPLGGVPSNFTENSSVVLLFPGNQAISLFT